MAFDWDYIIVNSIVLLNISILRKYRISIIFLGDMGFR